MRLTFRDLYELEKAQIDGLHRSSQNGWNGIPATLLPAAARHGISCGSEPVDDGIYHDLSQQIVAQDFVIRIVRNSPLCTSPCLGIVDRGQTPSISGAWDSESRP